MQPPPFLNRTTELAALKSRVSSDPVGNSLTILLGPTGVGKSSLSEALIADVSSRKIDGVHVNFAIKDPGRGMGISKALFASAAVVLSREMIH
jgi:predicted GTPase